MLYALCSLSHRFSYSPHQVSSESPNPIAFSSRSFFASLPTPEKKFANDSSGHLPSSPSLFFSKGDCVSMASSSSSPNSATAVQNSKKRLGLIANAMKRKESFFQFFVMTGILFLSMRSLSQKYMIHDLSKETHALKEEQESLTERMKNIKRALLHEASLDSSGLFASRLRLLFGQED